MMMITLGSNNTRGVPSESAFILEFLSRARERRNESVLHTLQLLLLLCCERSTCSSFDGYVRRIRLANERET